ncbi:MAG: DUF4900 domain-containing protein [Dictyoglomus turgidum]|nr:MAG: DUF4900 domain-containing protein [Dictyoglomus turgidum]
MKIKKGEKGDISLITAITFAIFITALIALVVNFPIEQSFFTRRSQARDQVLYATQVGIKTVLTTARYYLKDQLTRRKLTDIDENFLSSLLSKNNTNFINTINYIYTNTSQVDPNTVYSILDYSFSLANYTAITRGGTTDEVSYTYVYTITCLGQKVNFNPTITLQVTVTGKIEGVLRKENFARFALFTDRHLMSDGSRVWFTNRTKFYGPVHTNGQFAFAYTPQFFDEVSSVATTAYFYNGGNPRQLAADSNPPRDIPYFAKGFTRGAPTINLPTVAYTQLYAALSYFPNDNFPTYSPTYSVIRNYLGLPPGNTAPPNGIYTITIANGGGIYIQGDASIEFGKDSLGRSVYTITQGSSTYVFTVDVENNKTYVKIGNQIIEINKAPNGVIYVNGNVTSIKGMVQKDQRITVVAKSNITITNHLTYEDDPRNNPDAVNVLGLLAETGNIIIDPKDSSGNVLGDPNIHAVLMAPNGVVQVANYSTRPPAGDVHLLGGIISKNYGAFGTFSTDRNGNPIPTSGYGRDFWYDYRMRSGYAPPYFPTTGRTIQEGNPQTQRWIFIDSWREIWK